MVSGLDLLQEQPKKTGIELLGQPTGKVRSGLDLLRPTTTAPTTEVPVAKAPSLVWKPPRLTGETVQEKMMASYLTPSLEEVSWVDEPLHKAAKDAFVDFAKGVGKHALAASELTMNLASSMLLFIPSKLYGAMALPWGREVANIAMEELAKLGYPGELKGEQYWLTEEGKKTAEWVGKGFEIFLSPATNLDQIISRVSPEIGYLVGFGAELAEFIMTGGIVKGVKAKFKPKPARAREIIEKKHELEQEVLDQEIAKTEGIPNEIIKKAQQEVINTEKIQSELRYREALDKFDYEPLIAEELGRKAEEVARIKQLRPKGTRQWWLDEARKAAKKKPEVEVKGKVALEKILKEEPKVEPVVDPVKEFTGELPPKAEKYWEQEHWMAVELEDGKIYYSPELTTHAQIVVEGGIDPGKVKSGGIITTEGYEVNFLGKPDMDVAARAKVKPVDPITEIDTQTGTRELPELDTHSSPFREVPEHTQTMKKVYEERPNIYKGDVEIFSHKLLNDANRWLDGEEVDIGQVRNALSELASRAEELRDQFVESSEYPSNFDNWKEMVSEAANWARKADRLKIEPTVDLNMMIPVDQVPGIVKDVYKNITEKSKNIRLKKLYRSREVFDKTGFWLGRDGKWRYELSEDRVNFGYSGENIGKAVKEEGFWEGKLSDVLDHPELLESMPKLKNTRVMIDPGLEKLGQFFEDGNIIRIKSAYDYDTLFHETQHAINWAAKSFRGSSIRAMLPDPSRPTFGELALARDRYMKTPGEMEARLASARMIMTPKERKQIPPWETLDEMLYEEGLTTMEAGMLPPGPGAKLYTGIPLDKAAKELVAGAKRLSEYTRRARGLKAFKPKAAAKALREEFNRSFIDRSGNIRRELLDQLSDEGYRTIQRMYLTKGATSLAANMLKQMGKEVYGGLSRSEKRILDNLILADRLMDISKYKTAKQFKFPEDFSPTDAAAYSELFQFTEKIDAKTARTLRQRAEAYFEWMKKPLNAMLEAELISKEEFDALASHNYRRIKLVDIFDKRYQAKVGKKKRTIYDSGVEALARGRETDIYEPSSEIMALEVFNRAYGRIFNNKANQNLLELARKDPTNPFVRVKEKKGDMIPSGWNRIFVYEKGQRKAIYLSPEMSKEWITSNPEMTYKLSQTIRYASMSPVLRTFATGINWGFAVANLPRDILHTWFAARVFENGKWKPIYNPNMPIFAFQMGRDLATIFTDAALRKGRYEEYIKEGGGMEFLVHQGRLFQRGRHVEGSIDKVYDFMGYFGETSEIMTRLAIRERVLRKRRKKGVKEEDARREATFAARDYMDFGQGGGIAKALDNGIPYLNAAMQGTRGLWRAFKENPISSTYKMSQFAALVSGLYIAMNKMHPQSSKALKGNIDMQNNLVIPLGDSFGFEDEKGQMHYPYLKIPLDPGQKFFKTFFEAATDKWLGNEIDIDRVVDSLKEQSPVGVTEMPPSISGVIGYFTNKDFWLNEDIWKKTDKPFGFPESKEEYIPGKTPQAYIDLGAKTGLSPERTKYLVEELTTNGTIWSYLLGQGYDAAFGDLPKSKKEQHLAMVLSEIPVIRRFFGITSPYSQFAQPIDKAKEKSDIDRWVQNRGLDVRVEGYLFEKNVERKEVIDYMRSFKDKKIYDRLKDRFEFQEKIKALPNRAFWLRLKGLVVEARAKVYVDRLERATPEEREQFRKELATVIRAGGVVSKDFRREVSRLRGASQ